ncbi:MAG: hypothetical protein LW850_02570, partial [Planctomycetaceae bacterium]|nr:hypothetical protein [Planctomycetaceae bacterium]
MAKLFGQLVALGCLGSFLVFAGYIYSQEKVSQETQASEMKLTEAWVVSSGQGTPRGRSSLPTDPIELAIIQDRLQMPDPKADSSPSAEGLPPWKKFAADEQGGFAGRELFGGTLAVRVDVPTQGIWLLDAQGHGSVRIDGAQRVGDVYSNGSVEIPVELQAGENWLLLSSGRGRIAAKLKKPDKSVYLSLRDTTFPTVLRDQPGPWTGSLLVVNASNETLD